LIANFFLKFFKSTKGGSDEIFFGKKSHIFWKEGGTREQYCLSLIQKPGYHLRAKYVLVWDRFYQWAPPPPIRSAMLEKCFAPCAIVGWSAG
jgi:hypothetical protein